MVTEIVTPRVGALEPTYEPAVAGQLEKMMPPNVPPIALFRTVVHNLPMAEAMTLWGSYELSRSLQLRVRLGLARCLFRGQGAPRRRPDPVPHPRRRRRSVLDLRARSPADSR